MSSLVMGVGVNDRKYPAYASGKNFKVYTLWCGLLKRCYGSIYQKRNPTYIGCSVSENFKNYSYFYEWAQQQIGFGLKNYHLDKDLILRGNRVYSEDTCVFLPSELNVLLTTRRNYRGSLPLGVSAFRDRFIVHCCTDKPSNHVGVFKTPHEAFQAYKQVKETYIKLQAEKWKAHIDPRAYAALMAYEVSPTD